MLETVLFLHLITHFSGHGFLYGLNGFVDVPDGRLCGRICEWFPRPGNLAGNPTCPSELALTSDVMTTTSGVMTTSLFMEKLAEDTQSFQIFLCIYTRVLGSPKAGRTNERKTLIRMSV